MTIKESGTSFPLTTVYGPSRDIDKPSFLAEIRNTAPPPALKWLILGDFNLIYRARDKSNTKLNLRRMRHFRSTLNSCLLKEVHLQNRKYTWSNERRNPTLVRLDRVFCNKAWDRTFDTHILQALSTSLSDHCPLLLSNQESPPRPRSFRFEIFWISMPGFLPTVRQAWSAPNSHTSPIHRLNFRLATTAKALRKWSKTLFSETRLQFHMAQFVILQLDVAQESRPLTDVEFTLRAKLKIRVMGLAILERFRKRQCSRITDLKLGDANTRYFHLKTNSRRRKNFITKLRHQNGWATTQQDKSLVAQNHYENALGPPPSRDLDLNWQLFRQADVDLSALDADFTEDEVKRAIKLMPKDKAPGPDGFSLNFFTKCWDIVKGELMSLIHAFHSGRHNFFDILNTANIVLIPKKEGGDCITDFRPISLIHAVAKIITKMLALRLQPHMNSLTSNSQSAFIKNRVIHDNFMYVRNLARRFHTSHTPTLLFKLDISKAFDSVRWDYLLELLQRRGFLPRWRSWVSSLLSTATSKLC